MDYYQTLISEAKALMESKNFNEAYRILEAECQMPYIPLEAEDEIRKLHKQCKQELDIKNRVMKHDESDIETLLFGSIDEACVACELLKNSNVRKYVDVIEKYLNGAPHFLIRTLLIEILMEQDVSDEIKMKYEGLDITFIPAYVEPVTTSDICKQAIKQLSDYFENDNPVFFQMCVECLIKELYLKLPFHVSEDELMYVIIAIIAYVYKANGDEEGYMQFINEKSLAMYSGYDLLLYEYNI